MKKTLVLLSVLALFSLPVIAEEQTPGTDNKGDKKVEGYNPCGDGTCDEAEKRTGGCPADCTAAEIEAGKKLCGDGTCDDFEKTNDKCKSDCDTAGAADAATGY